MCQFLARRDIHLMPGQQSPREQHHHAGQQLACVATAGQDLLQQIKGN